MPALMTGGGSSAKPSTHHKHPAHPSHSHAKSAGTGARPTPKSEPVTSKPITVPHGASAALVASDKADSRASAMPKATTRPAPHSATAALTAADKADARASAMPKATGTAAFVAPHSADAALKAADIKDAKSAAYRQAEATAKANRNKPVQSGTVRPRSSRPIGTPHANPTPNPPAASPTGDTPAYSSPSAGMTAGDGTSFLTLALIAAGALLVLYILTHRKRG